MDTVTQSVYMLTTQRWPFGNMFLQFASVSNVYMQCGSEFINKLSQTLAFFRCVLQNLNKLESVTIC